MADTHLSDAIDKMQRYGSVRDRAHEREPRYITLTDDEAVAVLKALESKLIG